MCRRRGLCLGCRRLVRAPGERLHSRRSRAIALLAGCRRGRAERAAGRARALCAAQVVGAVPPPPLGKRAEFFSSARSRVREPPDRCLEARFRSSRLENRDCDESANVARVADSPPGVHFRCYNAHRRSRRAVPRRRGPARALSPRPGGTCAKITTDKAGILRRRRRVAPPRIRRVKKTPSLVRLVTSCTWPR